MKKKTEKVIKAKTDFPIEDAIKHAKKIVKDEVLIIRMDNRRKKEIQRRAKRANVSMSAYMLLAEDRFSHSG